MDDLARIGIRKRTDQGSPGRLGTARSKTEAKHKRQRAAGAAEPAESAAEQVPGMEPVPVSDGDSAGSKKQRFPGENAGRLRNADGIINLIPESWELIEYQGEPWIRFFLSMGKRRAEKLSETGIMTRFQYKSELFGENNEALQPVLDLITMQRQGITEGIKNGNSYRFWAQSDNWASDEDLGAEMERFNKFTFGNKKTAGGVLIFPNTYTNINEMKTFGFTVDKEQQEHIKANVFDYFAVNEDILQSKAVGDKWLAFYESIEEWFAIQLLQYMSNADKLNAVMQLGDRGLATRNELREILNLDPLPEEIGNQIPARGEYYDVTNPPESKTGEKKDGGENDAG